MKITSLAIAAACLALGAAPACAVSLGLGGSASVSVGSAGLSVGAAASTDTSVLSLRAGLDGSLADTAAGEGVPDESIASTMPSGDGLGRVVRLIERSNWSAGSFAGITGVANGSTYDVTGMVNAGNQAAFELALSDNADEIGELRAALAANASLNSWLEAQGTDASEVIALGVAADGSLAVFTH
jgi:hypothetical protein